MEKMRAERIAENGDKCFVCSQGNITRVAIDKLVLEDKELYCRFCGCIHVAKVDSFDGFKKIYVKGVKY